MNRLNRIFKRFEDDMAAVAFAEAGEVETARAIMREPSQEKIVRRTVRKRAKNTVPRKRINNQ